MTMLVALAAAAVGASWSQLGNPISGDSNDAGFGGSISMSSSGDDVLVGGYVNNTHLYSWASSAWSDAGVSIGGSGDCDVALSGNGLVMAIAYADATGYFYYLRWVYGGGNLDPQSGLQSAGGYLAACTAATNNDGRVLAFGYCTRGTGGQIVGVQRATSSGSGGFTHSYAVTYITISDALVTGPFTVAVSAGSTVNDIYVAVGAPTAHNGQGAAFVFHANDGVSFVQLGNEGTNTVMDIVATRGLGASDAFGTSVSLVGDANSMTLAVGSPEAEDTSATVVGRVDLFHVSGSNAIITTKYGDVADDKFGTSVALSEDDDQNTLVVGAPQTATGNGYVKVYQGSGYPELGDGGINGTANGDAFGTAVAISGNGYRIAVGAPGHGNGEVTAWEYVTTTTTIATTTIATTTITTTTITTTTITTTTITTTTVIMAIIITLDGDLGQMSPQNKTDLTNAIIAYLESKGVAVTNVTLVSGSIVAAATLDPSTTGDDLESLESAVQVDIAAGTPVGGLQMLDVSTSGGDPPATTSSGTSAANLGAIIGGSVGGVALIAAAVYFLRGRGDGEESQDSAIEKLLDDKNALA